MKKYTVAIRSIYDQGQPVKTFEVEAENKSLAFGLIFEPSVREQWGSDNVHRFTDILYDHDMELVYIREQNE